MYSIRMDIFEFLNLIGCYSTSTLYVNDIFLNILVAALKTIEVFKVIVEKQAY